MSFSVSANVNVEMATASMSAGLGSTASFAVGTPSSTFFRIVAGPAWSKNLSWMLYIVITMPPIFPGPISCLPPERAGAVADAVWDAATADHTDVGSFGLAVGTLVRSIFNKIVGFLIGRGKA